MGVLSPDYLFLNGARGGPDNYLISNQAYNYLLDFPLLILGLIALSENFYLIFFVLALIGIVIFPAAIRGVGQTLYSFRAALLFPLICGLAAWGAIWSYHNLGSRIIKKSFVGLLIIGYTLSLGYFLIMYWYRTPFEKNEGGYSYKRAMTRYAMLSSAELKNDIFVITSQPPDTFNIFLFFSGLYSGKNQIKQINQTLAKKDYQINQIRFLDNCKNIVF